MQVIALWTFSIRHLLTAIRLSGLVWTLLFLQNGIEKCYADTPAESSLANLCKNPRSLRLPRSDKELESYQFELLWYLTESKESKQHVPTMRTICESQNGICRLLVMSSEGLPYAFVGSGGAYFVSSTKEGIVYFPRVQFDTSLGDSSLTPGLRLSDGSQKSLATLDVFRLCHRLLSEEHDCKYSKVNGRYSITKKNGSIATVEVSRRNERGGMPISRVRLHTGEGLGFEIRNVRRDTRVRFANHSWGLREPSQLRQSCLRLCRQICR